MNTKHIVLVGFKSTGKSVIGRELAEHLHLPHVDVDDEIERLYNDAHETPLACRGIFRTHGEDFFRGLEAKALASVLGRPGIHVVSTGGGAVMDADSQELLKTQNVVHVTANKGAVYERIMVQGKPAIFDEAENPFVAFTRLWDARNAVYTMLADHTVDNTGSLEQSIRETAAALQLTPAL